MKQSRMTPVESIILSAAARTQIRNSTELAKYSGIPTSTIRDKMLHPGKIRLSDLAAIDKYCPFTPEEALSLIRRCTA